MPNAKCAELNKTLKGIIKNCRKLAIENNVPFVFWYQTFGSVQVMGTSRVKEKLLRVIVDDGEWDSCLKTENLALGRGEDCLGFENEADDADIGKLL